MRRGIQQAPTRADLERCIMRSVLLPIVALMSLFAFGCQSSTSQMSQTMTTPQKAIVVTGGNGATATVFLPSSDPTNPVVLCAPGDAVCPECKAAAIKYFQTGVLDPKCSPTGPTGTAAAGVPPYPSSGHN